MAFVLICGFAFAIIGAVIQIYDNFPYPDFWDCIKTGFYCFCIGIIISTIFSFLGGIVLSETAPLEVIETTEISLANTTRLEVTYKDTSSIVLTTTEDNVTTFQSFNPNVTKLAQVDSIKQAKIITERPVFKNKTLRFCFVDCIASKITIYLPEDVICSLSS